ncbi:cation:proton antiporter [Hazenella coriacea]|uniref:Transporter (CPA2 family) n=1 Tax=Hazenella coriacea TaxID=1179467 RepID=A0A4R3L0E3_9BACL|nr:cation:proton antiporter [Hazenella coriacea]TCS92389.1 transporter (CPA2 family) [Hazenella coriacea]
MQGGLMGLFLEVSLALAAIIAVARICGWLAYYIGQPRVVGEMIAGVLVGPSFLGLIAPEIQATIFPKDVIPVLFVLSNIGLALYMFLVGADVDHQKLTGKMYKHSMWLFASGLIPTFVLGGVIAYFFYDTLSLPHVNPIVFAIFLGASISLTAFPMLARILQEENLTHSRIGTLSLIAASLDDAAAWCLVALAVALAQAKSILIGLMAGFGGAIFAVLMLTVGKRLFRIIGEKTEQTKNLSHTHLAIILISVLLAAWFTDYIGIFSVFGGFITGLAMPKNPVFLRELHGKLSDIVIVFLVPIFFVYSGLNTQLTLISHASALVIFLIVLLASVAGKYGGCTLTMKLLGYSFREASAIGGLMNARGLMVLILVNIGFMYNIITKDLFAVLVLMAIVTTALAMPIYRFSYPRASKNKVKVEEKELIQQN